MSSNNTPSDTLTNANVGSSSWDDTTQNPQLSVERGGNIQPEQVALTLALAQDVLIHPPQLDQNLIGPMVDLWAQPNTILNPQIRTGN